MTTTCNNQQFQTTSEEHSKSSGLKSEETLGISQEMTMMPLISEQTGLSSSSSSDMEATQVDSTATSSDDDFPLTYWDVLKNQTSSVYDLLDRDHPFPQGVDPSDVLQKPKWERPSVRPYIAFNDLNNSDDAPYENKPKPAIEIGISFDF